MFDFDEIVDKIVEQAKVSREDVLKQVEEKQVELSGLVSKEGAAYIVGRELGINLLKEGKRSLKINNVVSGMKFVDLTARITRVFDIREFEREGKKGKVVNVFLGDETGVIRLSLWNEETELVGSGQIKEDDVVKITGGYVKIDNRGGLELRLGRGRIEKADEEIAVTENVAMTGIKTAGDTERMIRKDISLLKEGDFGEIRGSIVQLFKRNPFYETCSVCSRRITQKEGKWFCDEHGEVKKAYRLVLSGIMDDGSGNMRVVFFGDIGEKIAGKTTSELRSLAEESADVFSVYEHLGCIGKEFIIGGKVKKNTMTENLEMVADFIEDVDPKKEIGIILKEYKL